jgi:hypothetical protein
MTERKKKVTRSDQRLAKFLVRPEVFSIHMKLLKIRALSVAVSGALMTDCMSANLPQPQQRGTKNPQEALVSSSLDSLGLSAAVAYAFVCKRLL